MHVCHACIKQPSTHGANSHYTPECPCLPSPLICACCCSACPYREGAWYVEADRDGATNAIHRSALSAAARCTRTARRKKVGRVELKGLIVWRLAAAGCNLHVRPAGHKRANMAGMQALADGQVSAAAAQSGCRNGTVWAEGTRAAALLVAYPFSYILAQ